MKSKSLFFGLFFAFSLAIFPVTSDTAFGQAFSYQPLEQIPGAQMATTSFPQYVQGIYKFGIWTVGLAALFMLSVGGFIYLSSGGNTATIGKAKTYIWDALIGLVLALLAYLILYVINPDLVNVNLGSFSKVGGSVPENGIQAPSAPGVPAKYTSTQCSNKPTPNGYYASGATGCQSGDASIGDFINDQGVVNGVCCAPKITQAYCPSGIACESCVGCIVIPGSIDNKGCGRSECFLNSNLLERIKKVSVTGWRITESWPPTVPHQSSCHKNGGCADLNNTGGATDPATIKKYYDAFNAAGLKTLYESKDCAPYVAAGIINCKTYPTMTNSSSFHVQ